MKTSLSRVERRLVEEIRASQDELVALARVLVSFDTCYGGPDRSSGQEAPLQRLLQDRLEAIGMETDLWEPPSTGSGNLHVPDDLSFAGRPQLVGHLAGSGRGMSLLLLGHIDCVPVGPLAAWTTPPFSASVRGGRVYGRGAADMKGGIASLLIALETLVRRGVNLEGDVAFCTVTDEESSGAGSYAAVEHGVRADAGLCAENTGFDVWTACRGSVICDIDVPGRAGHAECRQPHWTEGGAVNAIDKAVLLLAALESLGEEWRRRGDHRHRLLPPGTVVPVAIHGGEWEATVPSTCRITANVQFLPGHVDHEGRIDGVREEVERTLGVASAADSWLATHPPSCTWHPFVVPGEIDDAHPLVSLIGDCAAKVGRDARIVGLDSWHDPANFIRLADVPTVSFGPGELSSSHVADEWVDVEALVDHCCAVALTVLHFCG